MRCDEWVLEEEGGGGDQERRTRELAESRSAGIKRKAVERNTGTATGQPSLTREHLSFSAPFPRFPPPPPPPYPLPPRTRKYHTRRARAHTHKTYCSSRPPAGTRGGRPYTLSSADSLLLLWPRARVPVPPPCCRCAPAFGPPLLSSSLLTQETMGGGYVSRRNSVYHFCEWPKEHSSMYMQRCFVFHRLLY